MNIDTLKQTWQSEDENVNSLMTINKEILESIQTEKQSRKFQDLKWARTIESIVFFFIVVSLWQYIATDFALTASTVSAFILNIFATVALAGNIGQIALISRIDFSQPVKVLQGKLFDICSHKLQITKLVILSVPFYMAYVLFGFDVLWGVDLYTQLSDTMLTFYIGSSALLLALAMWFVSKLSYQHIETPWVKSVISLLVGERLMGMAEFLREAETS